MIALGLGGSFYQRWRRNKIKRKYWQKRELQQSDDLQEFETPTPGTNGNHDA
jgi:hypothetical protein